MRTVHSVPANLRGAFARRTTALAASLVAIVLVASCGDDAGSPRDCDRVARRCRTVCQYWCDYWGCYPQCWDQCWYDCYDDPDPPPPGIVTPPPATQDDAGAGGAVSDGGGSGASSLCAPCGSNDDCAPGSLCIVKGGPRADASADGGAPPGFCGQSCATSADCPSAFSCAQIGASRQCLPVSGGCD